MCVSRDTFYLYLDLMDGGGIESLINRSSRTTNLKRCADEIIAPAVIAYVNSMKYVRRAPAAAIYSAEVSLSLT